MLARLLAVLVVLAPMVSAVECPPGFEWQRMSGVGCVQSDCTAVGAGYGYTKNCFCRDKKTCSEPVDYTRFDREKCGPHCPYSRVVACVEDGKLCPKELESQAATPETDTAPAVPGVRDRVETIITSITDYVKDQGYEDEQDYVCGEAIEEAAKPLDDLAAHAKKMKTSGKSDREVAEYVVSKIKARVSTPNNFWRSPWTTIRHNFIHNYEDFFDWRDQAVFDHDTMAFWSWHNRLGQCEENAAITYYILKRAGYDARFYRQEPGDHAYVIVNPTEGMDLKDSRKWSKDTIVADSWQGKVLNGKQAYKNRYIMDNGRIGSAENTEHYVNKHRENIKDRNLCWNQKTKKWSCKKGHQKKYMNGAYQGYCVKEN